jgi:hypothetical protein
MPKYRVYGQYYATKFLGVFEADTEEEAIEQGLRSDAAIISVPQGLDFEIDDAAAQEGFAVVTEND